MLMLYNNEDWWTTSSQEEISGQLEAHNAFARYLQEQGGSIVAGAALRVSTTATTLRPDGDGMLVTDGPYAELKEQLGGFYIIEARDLDQALDAAKHCPLGSGTEVRPVWEIPGSK
ncbi:MAG: hypothetical protein H0W23_01705 [Chloroflexia bacterium]|nr:hypothetical protein [Chloroflexia bacterium]